MKRYVLLVGGTGARIADALLTAASAGVFPAETLEVLLADTDRRGVRSARLAAAKMADYARVHDAMRAKSGPFAVQLNFTGWPASLPGDASTLSQWTSDLEEDQLLCQALFDRDASSLDLREGFHGRRTLGQVTFAGLLHEADQDPEDALSCLVDDMARAAQEGEEVRVVVAGSVCGGTGAAGIPALCRYVRERTEHQVRLGAVLLGAGSDQEDAVNAHDTLSAYAREGLCDTIGLLALPQSSRTSAPVEYPQLMDWLAVYMMDVLLHRPEWLRGLFTVRAPQGVVSWELFGKAAMRYRVAYGQLMKAAAAWQYVLGPTVERRLEKPLFLRDELLGWYAHFFRRMKADRQTEQELAACLSRLSSVWLLWLGGVSKTLPLDMRYASALGKVRREAREHYEDLITLSSQLVIMDDDAQRNELYADNLVYRSNRAEAEEAEQAMKRISAVKQEISRRRNEQVALQRRMGGSAVMAMLDSALEAARAEQQELRERHDEANRRIDHAEAIASADDQYRITDARTKLKRMERHQLLLDSRVEQICQDVEAAVSQGVRFDKPAMAPAPAENGMFLPDMAERFLQRDKLTRADVEARWHQLVAPDQTVTLKQAMKAVRRAPVDKEAPLVSLFAALLAAAMQEGGKEARE